MKKAFFSLSLLLSGILMTGCSTSGSNILSSVGSSVLSNALSGNGSSSSSSAASTGTSVLGSLLSGGSSSTGSSSSSSSVLGNLLSTFLGNKSITQSDLVGTWNYTGSDCVFESENLLAKAGGTVAASKIESEINSSLSKFGIKEGSCSFTFKSDNTYTATIGGRTISGNYTLNSSDKTIKMTYLAGLGSMTPHITKSGSKISLLIESSKLLTLVKGVSAVSGSSSLKTISSLLSNYDGLYIGMQLSK